VNLFKKVTGSIGQGMTERPGEFGMSNFGIMKNFNLHRYQNANRKPEIK